MDDVELTERVERELHRAFVVGALRVIAAHEGGGCADARRNGAAALHGDVGDDDFRAGRGKAFRDRLSDAGTGARDESDATVEALCHGAVRLVFGGRVISINAATRPRRWRYWPSMKGSSVRHSRSASDIIRVSTT